MQKPESTLENETHKILLDFELQADHPFLARRPDLILIYKKKRTCDLINFAILVDFWVKRKEIEKIKYLLFLEN